MPQRRELSSSYSLIACSLFTKSATLVEIGGFWRREQEPESSISEKCRTGCLSLRASPCCCRLRAEVFTLLAAAPPGGANYLLRHLLSCLYCLFRLLPFYCYYGAKLHKFFRKMAIIDKNIKFLCIYWAKWNDIADNFVPLTSNWELKWAIPMQERANEK